MSTDTEHRLRAVLALEAERYDVVLDPGLIARAARARRRRWVTVGVVATVAALTAGSVVVGELRGLPAQDRRDLLPQRVVPTVATVADPLAPATPWCEPRTGAMTQDVLHVGGRAYETPCAYENPHHRYLWYHAGRLVASAPDGLDEFVRGEWVHLADTVHADVRVGVDGAYVAWVENGVLVVHGAPGREVARAALPDELTGAGASVEGIDASGRVYLRAADGALWLKAAPRPAPWARLRGLPEGRVLEPMEAVSYVTADGLAVLVRGVGGRRDRREVGRGPRRR